MSVVYLFQQKTISEEVLHKIYNTNADGFPINFEKKKKRLVKLVTPRLLI